VRVEEGGAGAAHAIAIMGDGRRDVRILRRAAEKYDHSRIIRIPEAGYPCRDQRECRRQYGKGLSGSIARLAALVSLITVDRFIILIDREHIGSIEDATKKLEEHGFKVIESEAVDEGCWKFSIERGFKKATLYIAILGWIKSIEENLAQLIQLLYGEHVEKSKEAIDAWLKKRGLSDSDLVERASREQFENAFPQLARILGEISQ